MHVIHVVRDLDETSGGISRSVPALASALASHADRPRVTVLFQDRGHRTVVDGWSTDYRGFNCDQAENSSGWPSYVSFRDSTFGWDRIRSAALEFIHATAPIDWIHLHGLWSPSVSAAAAFARRHSIRYVIAPRGMLSPWAMKHRKHRKSLAWIAYQKRDLANAAFIHVTSDAERDDVLRWVPAASCRLIPNAIEVVRSARRSPESDRLLDPRRRWCLALGRIHPIKGLDRLIAAWARGNPAGWGLAIAGPDEGGHLAALRMQVDSLGLADDVRFLGPIADDQTDNLLSQADLVVQASHSENFGIVIADSLAVGTPVIASRGTPWQSLETAGCGWWVDNGVDSLAGAIQNATSLSPAALAAMGYRGIDLVRKHYGPATIADQMIQAYAARAVR